MTAPPEPPPTTTDATPRAPTPGVEPQAAPIASPAAVPGGRRWLRRTLLGVNITVAIALIAATTGLVYVKYRYGQIAKIFLPGLVHGGEDSAGAVDTGTGMTILLVGNNTRTGLDPKEARQFGTASEVGGARSDVTMLLHLDPVDGASILSIPRDLFVPMPPHSMVGRVGKIDAALNDGPEQLVEAITNDLGIPIDHYVSINFDGFQRVVDALGGIDLSFPTQLRDSYSGLRVSQTGCAHLSGTVALAVVRSRHLQYLQNGRWVDDPQSDLSRIRRDHEFLTVFAKTVKAQGLTNPLKANAVLGQLVHQVTIDQGLTVPVMLGLLKRYRGLNPEAVPELTLPVTLVPELDYRYEGGGYGSVVFPSQPADRSVIDTFLGRTPLPVIPGPVKVVDDSGIGAGRKVAAGLTSEGFTVTESAYGGVSASPSETIVRYHQGDLPAAQRVLSSLAGAAVLTADQNVPAGIVELDVGSVVTVAGSGPAGSSASGGASPSGSASGGASPSGSATGTEATASAQPGVAEPSVAAAAPASGTTASGAATASRPLVPTPGGQPISAAVTPLQSFDPTGC